MSFLAKNNKKKNHNFGKIPLAVPAPHPIKDNGDDDVLEPLDESLEKEFHSLDLIKESELVSVTVYQKNSALCVRRVQVNVSDASKEQIIQLQQVSEKVDSRSVRAAISMVNSEKLSENIEGPPFKIADVSHVIKVEDQKNDQSNKLKLEEELQQLMIKNRVLSDECDKIARQKKFLTEYRAGVVTVSQKDVQISRLMDASSIQSMTRFMECYTTEIEKLEKAEMKLEREKAELAKKMLQLRTDIAKEKAETTKETLRSIVVTVVAQVTGQLIIDVSYLISGAYWKPTYDVRVNCTLKKLELFYYGIITQKTEEDWMDTAIALSTADPTERASPMTLQRMTVQLTYGTPNHIAARQSRRRGSYSDDEDDSTKNESVMMDALCDDFKADRMSSSSSIREEKKMSRKAASVVHTTTEQGVISTVFHIPRKASIPSDDSPHKVSITSQTFDAQLSYSTVPKLDTNAYLKAETTNTSSYPILEGDMNVFVDNNFVSTGTMTACNPNEELSSFLGSDPSIKVNYAAPKRYKETVGLMKGNSKASITRKVTIKNTKQVPVSLTVVDQIPKSADEKIKVKATYPAFKDLETTEALRDFPSTSNAKDALKTIVKLKEQANVEWELSIPASKEVDIELSYNVTWPVSNPLDLDTL